MQNNNFKITEKNLISFFGVNNYLLSKNIKEDNIKKTVDSTHYDYHLFKYIISDNNIDYKVTFTLFRNRIRNYNCECEKFVKYERCEHIVSAFTNEFTVTDKQEDLSLDTYYSDVIKKLVKKDNKTLIGLDILFLFNNDYENEILVKCKVGADKKYATNAKLHHFFETYSFKNRDLELGKYFTYKPNTQYFDEIDDNILSYLLTFVENGNYNSKGIQLNFKHFKTLLKLMKNKSYTIENIKQNGTGYKEELPCKMLLTENNNNYNFKLDLKNINFLNSDNSIAFDNNTLYFIPNEIVSLTSELLENSIENIKLDKNDAISFSKKMTPIIKENYLIEEKLEDEFKIITPVAKLYFDFNKNIELKIILIYNKKDVNYFDKITSFRDENYENNLIEALKKYGFYIKGKSILLDKVNLIVDFIEKGIFELKEKFEVYTSENFDIAKVVKASGIKSQFSIGTDNIMTYKFDLDGIDPSELNKLFDSMENKVKYFKLKNGNILNTEDSSLEEFKKVCDNLNIEDYASEGSIPKYRALYLDSIKNYSVVNTDNLFNNFIENFNKYKNAEIKLSKKDLNILRDYQITGVRWMYNVYKSGFGGILADEMGLGKTIQTIMFIKNIIKENKDAKILIVAPTSLIYNWEHEFDMFGSELQYKVIANNKEKRLKSLDGNENIFITTYGLLRQDKDIYSSKNFELIIIDEAQNIKNPKAGISTALKTLKANSKMALTGTPVENSIIEIWSIFDFLMPGYLNSLSNFQNKFNIKNMDEESKDTLNDLTTLISPFILRRRKKEVLLDLPDKLENNIYLDLLPEQKKYYIAQVKKSKEEFEELIEKEGFLKARFKILQLLTRLRQLCIDPKIVYENFDYEAVKIVELLNIVSEYVKNNHKILVFTSFKTALDIVKSKLDENGFSNYVIDGSVPSKERNNLVNAFNKDNTNVFLITLKSGGTGLNLTSADVVIHLDLWWNPQAENQATDRAHRIGQKNTVEVIKLICKGTIEEKIVELQNKKKILSDTLIENEEISNEVLSKLSEKDIIDLLSLSE